MMRHALVIIVAICAISSCNESPQKYYTDLLKEWIGKEVRFPDNPVFTIQGEDTVLFKLEKDYKILTYTDSLGCTSCKLQLGSWQQFMTKIDTSSVRILFFFSPEKRRDIVSTLKAYAFTYPVCIDERKELDRLNHFPTESGGQTFLLDKDNKILAMGNPIHNPRVKDFDLKIIQEENASAEAVKPMTTASIDRTSIMDMGTFDWRQKQTTAFTLTNTGDKPLAIEMVDTSCGCIEVKYDKEPVRPGGKVTLHVTYKADQPEYFSKTLTVYCNAEEAPLRLTVKGYAE